VQTVRVVAAAMAVADYSDVDYFEEASSSIEQVQQLASHQVQLNLFQCQFLSSKLAETGSFLNAKSDTLRAIVDRNDIRRKALLMLHFTVKRAEKLVQNCCCEMESWLESAVTLAQIKEDIVDILLDLRWWTSMVEIAIASVTWMSSGQQIELELLECAEADFESLLKQLQLPFSELDEAVTKDKDQLMKRLGDVQASYGGRNGDPQQIHQFLLAAHVRSRLENVFETMGDADLNVYEDSRIIGQGSFGAVMNVRWLGRRCALKMLKYKCPKEATSLSAFQHPHIVQFFRYWEAPYGVRPSETPYCTPRDDTPGSTPYSIPHRSTANDAPRSDASMSSNSLKELQSHILMELLPTDLAEHMKALIKANAMKVRVGSKRRSEPSQELPMSEDAAIDVMLQIAKAMWHLNSKEVAHRDLKPNNVLVRSVSKDEVPELSARGYLRVKLGDFGLAKTKAKSLASSPQTRMVGTPAYGAPEVFGKEIISEKKFPRQADVWSFGIMFNEVLSGKPPFDPTDGQKAADLQGRIRRGWRPALPENCSDYLKFCITSCWELRPQNRPNFSDLWKMVRFAQVRSLGLIRENHDLFTFRTSDSVKRLHPLKRTPVPASFLDNKGSLNSNLIWRVIWRITCLLVRSKDFDLSVSLIMYS
jgi:serine/threonine protein kinase